MIKKPKKPTVSKLKKKLDIIFSQYIRLRDADPSGFVYCCTCGKKLFWKEAQNGHWISRNVLITRYNENNCHAQCVGCNMFSENGKPHLHELFIVDHHGADIRDNLLELSKKTYLLKAVDYKQSIERIKGEVDYLKKIKGL